MQVQVRGQRILKIGSHMENLQRKGGFKGFNQHAGSLIIAETDPWKRQQQHA